MMRAVSCCSGGVMFVPDEMERKTNSSKSYKDIAAQEPQEDAPKRKIFGKRKSAAPSSDAAVCTAA